MTRDELVTYITGQAPFYDVADNLTYVHGLLDLALEDIASWANWPWMSASVQLTPTASTASTALDMASITNIQSITRSDGKELTVVTPQTAYAEYGNPPSEGSLKWVFYLDDQIHYAPIPDSNETVTIIYSATEAGDVAFATGTSTPPFAERFHRIVAEFALWKIWQSEEDHTKARDHENTYFQLLGAMVRTYINGLGSSRLVLGEPSLSMEPRSRTPWLEV